LDKGINPRTFRPVQHQMNKQCPAHDEWREQLNGDCPRRDAHSIMERCDLICPHLPKVLWARASALLRSSWPPRRFWGRHDRTWRNLWGRGALLEH